MGDLFNYAAPGIEFQDGEDTALVRSMQSSSLCISETTDEPGTEQSDTSFQRLTDGGFDENLKSYCFYARRTYDKGEQVTNIWFLIWQLPGRCFISFCLMKLNFCFVCFHNLILPSFYWSLIQVLFIFLANSHITCSPTSVNFHIGFSTLPRFSF